MSKISIYCFDIDISNLLYRRRQRRFSFDASSHRIFVLVLFVLTYLLTYLLTTSQQEQCHISVNRTIRYIDVEPIIDIDDIEAPLVCSGRMTFSRDEVMRMESRMREEDNVTSIASAVSRRLKLIRSAETGSGQSRNGNIREARW